MRLTIESTNLGVDIGFGLARLWKGSDDKGRVYLVVVWAVGTPANTADAEVEASFKQIGDPSNLEVMTLDEAVARIDPN